MTSRQQRQVRRKWKENKKLKRAMAKKIISTIMSLPSISDSSHLDDEFKQKCNGAAEEKTTNSMLKRRYYTL